MGEEMKRLICFILGHQERYTNLEASKGFCARCAYSWDNSGPTESMKIEMQLVECIEFLSWLKGHDHWLVQLRLRELCRKLEVIGNK
jgi:hypothetical protein